MIRILFYTLGIVFLSLSLSLSAATPLVLVLEPENSQVLLLDREGAHVQRRAASLPKGQPPSVLVEHPDAAGDQWHEVRWVLRFPLDQVGGKVTAAVLHLWAQSRSGDTQGVLELEALEPLAEEITAEDRSRPAAFPAVELSFPPRAAMLEIDLTEILNGALAKGWSSLTIRIRAVSQERLDTLRPGRYYFGGVENHHRWPESHPPTLEIIR